MTRTADLARGKWRGILLSLGASADHLKPKHGPCPFCGGKDRYRWDNRDGTGSFFCSQCGAGDGFEFLRRLKGWDFLTAASHVDQVVGNVCVERIRKALPDERRRELLNRLWQSGTEVRTGDPVAAYLHGRGVPLPQNLACLRYVERCPVPCSDGMAPAMLAMVTGPDGKPATLHRTFLGPNGKADMDEPRALMPGKVPDGAAVRLSMHGERLGVAEGIETALKAGQRFGMPVWSTINATMLAKWTPPKGVRSVVVFGDNDAKFGGAAAAYALAHRLACWFDLEVEVKIPDQVGADWADVAA